MAIRVLYRLFHLFVQFLQLLDCLGRIYAIQIIRLKQHLLCFLFLPLQPLLILL